MKMQQLEAMGQPLCLEHLGGDQKFARGQAELGMFTSAVSPLAAALAQQTHAHANDGFDAQLPGDRDNLAELFELLDDHDDLLAQLRSEQGHAHEGGILIAVANDQAPELVLESQAGEEFRLAANFEPEVIRLASVENFFNDFAELVDFDWEDAAVFALVIKFGDGAAKRQIDRLDPVSEDVLESDQNRKLQPARLGFFDDVGEIDRGPGIPLWLGGDSTGFADIEVTGAPPVNAVQIPSLLDIPRLAGLARVAHFVTTNRTAL